jgi:hypothetical protein
MGDPQVDVVVRCRNGMPFVESTIERLLHQRECSPRITFFDCGSSESNRRVVERHRLRIIDIAPTRAISGALMNHAMRVTTSQVVVFVNADAIPLAETTLSALLKEFHMTPVLAAAFGRQIARQPSLKAFTRDLLRGGDGLAAIRSRASFSLAAAAVHRSAWNQHAFDEQLRYAEDIEWTTRIRRDGWATSYVASAPFEQSQETTLGQRVGQPASPPIVRDPSTGLVASKRVTLVGVAAVDPLAALRRRAS